MRRPYFRLALSSMCALAASCAADSGREPRLGVEVGAAELSLSLPDGTKLDALDYRIKRHGFDREDSVPVANLQSISFQIGGLPAAHDYAITLRGETSNGTKCAAGPLSFDIDPGQTAMVRIKLKCGDDTGTQPRTGSVRVDVEVDPSAGTGCGLEGLSAVPSATDVGGKIALRAHASTSHAQFEWSATPDDDALADDSGSKTEFECKSKGTHTVKVVLTGKGSCQESETVELTCGEGTAPPPPSSVTTVEVAVTNVTAQVYADGRFDVTFIPRASDGTPVLDADQLSVAIDITLPAGQAATVATTTCKEPNPGAGLSVGVIIDDSGSMAGTDPQRLRRDAVLAFLDKLRAGDEVLLTDYGAAGSSLRDLTCASGGGVACAPAAASGFTSNLAKLRAAADLISAGGGTPLYQACRDMVPLVGSRGGRNQAILLLSDGEPSDRNLRTQCLDAASAAMIPVYTVGLGPAAEGTASSSAPAVMVLREISSTTKAGYASAALPDLLQGLFLGIAAVTTEGSCTTTAVLGNYQSLARNTQVSGTLSVGGAAMGSFGFVSPL